MADLGLSHNLATILNALASIDRRLGRIETTLNLPTFSNGGAGSVSGPSPSPNPATGASAVQGQGAPLQAGQI
ncbi:hypothetical protein C8A05DRAFT_38043, partial [Staphylotrichum tortipilum]